MFRLQFYMSGISGFVVVVNLQLIILEDSHIVDCRLSTIRNADTIAVVRDGQIVEKGTHKYLITQEGGAYSKLLNLAKSIE